ncbi:MAG: BTAD domain-containing putative transcriptional regulator [Actinomycetota bacterium]|nr:BTAD domain-containing putative transcriptional regulator [Actinomycetota bacterium]
MHFGVLGPVVVSDGDGPMPLGGPKQCAILGMLLMDPGRAIPANVAVIEVWGDDAGKGAMASLHTHVSNLRGVVGKERIVRDAAGYRLVLHDDDVVDASLFTFEVSEARHLTGSDPTGAAALFKSSLRRWRGRPFEGLEDVPMLAAEIARLDELRVAVELDRYDTMLRSGDTPPVGDVEALCRCRPLDERPWGLLMKTLYRSGQQAEALRTYTHVKSLFGEEMGIEPSPSLTRIEEQILLHDPALDPMPTAVPPNLPVFLTSFIGRVDERQRLEQALDDHRLVTVTGPGGVGKTRLAVEVAASLHPRFPDGVWLVDLAQVSDSTRVAATVAASVEATGSAGDSAESAAAALSGRRVLVILDNCEHVVGAVRATTETMLQSAPGLVILTTSRIALGSPGEFCFALDGLAIEGAEDTSSDAAALFKDRANAVRSNPDQAESGDSGVAAICRRLDGMPLALELAAARSDVLSPIEIADLLTRRFSILVDGRQHRDIHRSLEATVGWSYGLLTSDERSSFAALGVFEGPFTAEDAAAILDKDPNDTITALEALATASLIRVEPHAGRATTYRLLETLLAYARDRLMESGKWGAVVERHDRHFLDVCSGVMLDLLIEGRPDALARISGVVAELVMAWDRMGEADPSVVLPIAWALGNHWLVRGGIAEGEQRIADLLHDTAGRTEPLRMHVLLIGALLADRRGHRDMALAWSDEALEIVEGTDEVGSIVVALNFCGRLRIEQGDHAAAIEALDRSVALADHALRHGGPPSMSDGRAWGLVTLAEARRWSGDPSNDVSDQLYEARRYFRSIGEMEGQVRADRVLVTMSEIPVDERVRLAGEMMKLARSESADGEMLVVATRAMAGVMWEMDDRDRAIVMNRAAVRSAMAFGSLTDLGSVLLQAAMFAGRTGRGDRAAKLSGAGHHQCGTRPGPYQQSGLEQAIEQARSKIGDDRFDHLYRIGAAMGPDEAAAFALG